MLGTWSETSSDEANKKTEQTVTKRLRGMRCSDKTCRGIGVKLARLATEISHSCSNVNLMLLCRLLECVGFCCLITTYV